MKISTRLVNDQIWRPLSDKLEKTVESTETYPEVLSDRMQGAIDAELA